MNLLIADDEWIYRDGLADIVRRQRPDMAVFTAANGLEALEIIESGHIDGMFLDIRMPKSDGFDLLRRLEERGIEDIVTVIVSGVNDFEYAQSAIRGNVLEYLLKPITPDEALATLGRIEGEVALRRSRREELSSLREMVMQHRREMQLQLMQDILSGNYDAGELMRRGEALNMPLRGGEFLCAVLELMRVPGDADFGLQRQVQILHTQDRLTAHFAGTEQVKLFHVQTDQFLLLYCAPAPGSLRVGQVIAELDALMARIYTEEGVTLTAGVGEPCPSLCRIPDCYADAVRALRYKTIFDGRETYSIRDFCRPGRVRFTADYSRYSMLMRERNLPELKKEVREALEAADRAENLLGLMLAFNEILLTILKVLNENNVDISDYFSPGNLGMKIPASLHSLNEIGAWLDGALELATEQLASREKTESGFLIQRILDYVAKNFARPINNAVIADSFGYSSNYLGRLFRREMGTGLNEYIKNTRIDRAKDMLRNTSLRINEIAQQTGFSDNQYFSVVFRQRLGCSPSDYRDMQ